MPNFDLEQATAHEDLCRFLSACWCEPTPAFAEERLFDSMLEAARRLGPELAESAQRLGEAYAGEDAQALLVDYARLFLGPTDPRARPYGSFWLNGEAPLMQDSTLAVLDLYARGGFELDGEARELPDHVAVELEFLYVLAFKRHRAMHANDADSLATLETIEQQLLEQQLGAWLGRFTAAVRAGAETTFYRELADLTERFLAHYSRARQ